MNDAVSGLFTLQEQEVEGSVLAALNGWYATAKTVLTEDTILVKYLDENPEILTGA